MRVEFNGEIHEFPDNFTDAQVKAALSSHAKQPAQVAPAPAAPAQGGGGWLDSARGWVRDNVPAAIRGMTPEEQASLDASVADAQKTFREANPTLGGLDSTLGRVAINSNPIIGVHDLAATGANLVGRRLGLGELPLIAPEAMKRAGVEELPADAGFTRRLLEGTASGLLGNPSALRQGVGGAVTRTAADVAGAEGGSYLGEKLLSQLGLGDVGAFLGGLAGASARSAGTNTFNRAVASQGRSDASEIAAAAERAGIPTTAGELGNERVGGYEKAVQSFPLGSGPVDTARANSRNAMERVVGEVADTVRGGPALNDPVLPGHVGQEAVRVAGTTADRLTGQAKAGEARLWNDIVDERFDTRPVIGTFNEQIARTGNQESEAGMRARRNYMLSKRQTERVPGTPPVDVWDIAPPAPGTTNLPAVPGTGVGPIGSAPPPPRFDYEGTFSHTIPGTPPSTRVTPFITLGQAKDMRTNLGASGTTAPGIAGRDYDSVYGQFTEQLRNRVDQLKGPGAFDAANAEYARIMGEGGPVPALEGIAGERGRGGARVDPMTETQAFNMIKEGMRAPTRMAPFTENVPIPDQGPTFGNFLETLGRPATPGPDYTFQPNKFATEWNRTMPESKAAVVAPGSRPLPGPEVGPTASPNALGRTLDDVARVAEGYDLPRQSYGLSKALGALASVVQGGGLLGNIPAAGVSFLPYGIGRVLESEGFKRSLAGQYRSLLEELARGAPIQAAAASQQ